MTANTLPNRTFRIRFDICDDAGAAASYTIVPLDQDNVLRAYRVNNSVASYTCTLSAEGIPDCTCPGFKAHKHCKHIACLQRAGMLPATELLHMRSIILLYEQKVAALATPKPLGNPWGC